jgi:hypothetical protein
MTKFITTFKAKAHSKTLTAADMIALCVYKTVKAKSEDKATILTYFLKKSFSPGKIRPDRQYPYQAITNSMYYFNGQLRAGKKWTANGWIESNGEILGVDITTLLTEEEVVQFREIASSINPDYVRNL